MKKWMAMAAALALVGAAVPHGFAENVYTPGTYAAQAKGFGGVVSVSVTFDEKGMTDVQVEAPDETSGIGSVAAEKLPAAILNAQSAQVDTVSGATFTSKAVMSAVEDCIAQASGQNTEAVVKMAPGTYTGKGLGFRISEPLTVNVTVDEEKITAIEVDEVNTSEKTALLQTVVDRMIPRMIGCYHGGDRLQQRRASGG